MFANFCNGGRPPPAGALAIFFHIFFKEVGAEGAEEKNIKISDHSNSNSNRTKSLAAVEKFSKILDFFQLQLRVLDFFAAVFENPKNKSLAAVEKNSKILENFSTAAKVSEIIAWQVAEWLVDKSWLWNLKKTKKGKRKKWKLWFPFFQTLAAVKIP